MDAYYPKEKIEFWCNKCDHDLVKSDDESTGNFYIQFGHRFNQETKQYDGDYVAVMYAVCSHCQEKD